jgi:hypothetical protein
MIMRFTVAWANVVNENWVLKFVLACMTLVLISVTVVTLKLSSRKPLVFERSCYSREVQTVDGDRTPSEIETFVHDALAMRFDTGALVKPGFLSENEEKFRTQEQQEFKKRDLSQKIIVNSVVAAGEKITVNADRLFTISQVRSALPFPLTLTLGTVARSEWNPYGLVILQVSAPASDKKPSGEKK